MEQRKASTGLCPRERGCLEEIRAQDLLFQKMREGARAGRRGTWRREPSEGPGRTGRRGEPQTEKEEVVPVPRGLAGRLA